jgi:cytochrome c oxidase cbb3-type subunit 1
MIMFGLCYYMVPRLTGREWASSRLIRVHFWCAAIGITIYFTALSIGGWWQGRMLNNPNVPFGRIINYLLPYLFSRSIAGTLMTTGHVCFAILLAMNVIGWGRRRTGGPTFFTEPAARRETAAITP